MNSEQTIETIETEILVIGAGPAGLTAGLYAARAGKKTIILEGMASSRLSIGYEIENYPGFISIDSQELREKFREHAKHFGAEIISGDVIDLNLVFDPKMVSTRDSLIRAKAVILATGKPMPRRKMIPGEEKLVGLGVSYCSTCDGPLFRGKKVVAVGNTLEAVDDVLSLVQMGCRVFWISGDDQELTQTGESNQNVFPDNLTLYPRTIVKEIVGKQRVEKVFVLRADVEEMLDVEGVFIFREVPAAPLFRKAGLVSDHRQCVQTDRSQSTNIEGVFAAGDLTCGGMQVVSAAGEGCVAALQAIKYLRTKKGKESA